jgi:hypothetical protein
MRGEGFLVEGQIDQVQQSADTFDAPARIMDALV